MSDTFTPFDLQTNLVNQTLVVTFDLVFIIERWLRHNGRLTPNTSVWQKVYSACAIIAAIVGAVGLILLSIYDVAHHKRMHDTCLGVFIIGTVSTTPS